MATLMQHLADAIGQQAGGIGIGRVQLDAVRTGGSAMVPQHRVTCGRRLRRGEAPFLLAAMEILVDAAPCKAVEALDRRRERRAVDAERGGELGDAAGARHGRRHGAAGRLVAEGVFAEICASKIRKAGMLGYSCSMASKVRSCGTMPWKKDSSAKRRPKRLTTQRVRAAQLDDPGMDADRQARRECAAGMV